MKIEIAGTIVEALADFALYWPTQRALFVADLHLGKCDHFRVAGMPIPSGSSDATLSRLSRLVDQTGARALFVLGDFWHARTGMTEQLLEKLATWRGQHHRLAINVVPGNHDRYCAHDVLTALNIKILADGHLLKPFVLHHYPSTSESGYTLSGHIHPGIALAGKARERIKLPCFWFGESCAVLPSFGEFTGVAVIKRMPHDCIIAIASDELVAIPRQAYQT